MSQAFGDVSLSQATQLLACRVEGKSLIDFSSVDSLTLNLIQYDPKVIIHIVSACFGGCHC